MHTSIKKLCAATLGLVLLFAITSSASAQSRYRDRGLSAGEKAAYIGGGAAAGAVIGGLLGGKKGAVIGGLLGAGGGTGAVLLQGRDDDRYGRYYGNRYYGNRYRRDWDNHRRDWDDHHRDWDNHYRDRDRSSYSWSRNRFHR